MQYIRTEGGGKYTSAGFTNVGPCSIYKKGGEVLDLTPLVFHFPLFRRTEIMLSECGSLNLWGPVRPRSLK